MRYVRTQAKGGTFFFTVVTYRRKNILGGPENVSLLKEAFRAVMDAHPFIIDAIVVLPDHLHCLWTLPESDNDFPTRWRLIKSAFSRRCGSESKGTPSISRSAKKEQAVWQRRYWEHQIRDEGDFVRHVEYIHYNPVKHGLAASPKEWVHSSFHRFVREGKYPLDWGNSVDMAFDANIGAE